VADLCHAFALAKEILPSIRGRLVYQLCRQQLRFRKPESNTLLALFALGTFDQGLISATGIYPNQPLIVNNYQPWIA
jgi:hypothetical protein